MADKKKSKRMSFGTGLLENAAQALESRKKDIDKRVKKATSSKKKSK